MSDGDVYRLSASTAVEPLVNRWVAWAHTMAPVPSSLHLRHYQVKLLQSYLSDPQEHLTACKDPKLRSGPFVDVPAERAAEVRDLLARAQAEQSGNLSLAKSLMEFYDRLLREAKGQSLEPFYEQVPPPLRGYVELVYDYHNRPLVRFYESLLYESPYYRKDLQSLKIFQQTYDNSRPFIMSTPRLAEGGHLDWEVPFDSPEVDELFRLDSAPRPLGYIRELLGLGPADEHLLLPLLTRAPAPTREGWKGSSARLRYFGHACVLVEWEGVSILTDPCIGVRPGAGGVLRLTYEDLPEKIDYVLITHNHHDHFCVESLLRLRHRVGCVVVPRSTGVFYGDPSLKLLTQKLGFRHVLELDALDSVPLPGGEIVAVPFMGEHADLPHAKTAYVVRAGGEKILFAADSDCLEPRMYHHVGKLLGPVETVFLGMECVGAPLSWSCGPFLPAKPDPVHEQSRRYKGCDAARAMRLLGAVGARRVFNYAMGLEPWLEHLLGLAYTEDAPQLQESARLLSAAREEGFADARLLFGQCEITLESQPPGGHSAYLYPPAAQNFAEDEFNFN